MVTVYDSTNKPNVFFLHGSRQKDSVAACLCTVALLVRTSWSPVSLMTRACYVHALSSLSTVLNSLGSLAQVLLITGVDKTMGVVGYHIEVRNTTDGFMSTYDVPGLGNTEYRAGVCSDSSASSGASPRDPASCSSLSSRAACAAPAALPPAVAPLPYVPPPYTTGTRRPDVYQPSLYERKMDEEEFDYRRRRSAQEQEQEQRYQQWQQERARERDPRYEW